MRRVHIITGLKQRMNEILGTDNANETPSGTPEITQWSIQAAMLENMRRMAAAMVGDANFGRPVRGLLLGSTSGAFTVTEGYGVTRRGDIIWLRGGASIPIVGGGTKRHLYIRYRERAIDGSTYPEGKKTSIIGEPGLQDIVYDDKAAYMISGDVADLFVQVVSEAGMPSSDPDAENCVYLGWFDPNGSVIRQNGYRGLPSYPNNAISVERVSTQDFNSTGQSNLHNALLNGTLTLGTQLIASTGKSGISSTIQVRDAAGTGVVTLEFVKGVLVSVVPAP